jgi:hypothetical protein
MNGPARVNDMLVMDNKELRDKKDVPDAQNLKAEFTKVIDIVGEMDASHTPAGSLEKTI